MNVFFKFRVMLLGLQTVAEQQWTVGTNNLYSLVRWPLFASLMLLLLARYGMLITRKLTHALKATELSAYLHMML